MAVINIDMEDGEQPISFTLSEGDAERFGAFMAECSRHKNALARIAKYPSTRDEEIGYEGCRKLARIALKSNG